MQTIYHPVISWEPLRISLIWDTEPPIQVAEMEVFLNVWLQKRADAGKCECCFKYLNVSQESKKNIIAQVQWLCSKCLPCLLQELEKIERLSRIEIGINPSDGMMESGMIQVPHREVTFENGERTSVAEFWISGSEISVGQFQEFSKVTGYKTIAENLGEQKTVYSNGTLWGIFGNARLNQPACCISFLDAQAYCEWAKRRLPTEAEIFAGCLLGSEIYQDYDGALQKRVQDALKSRKLAKLSGISLTSETTVDGLVIGRQGPRYVLTKGWEKQLRENRYTCRKDYHSILTQFHVCAMES